MEVKFHLLGVYWVRCCICDIEVVHLGTEYKTESWSVAISDTSRISKKNNNQGIGRMYTLE